ncbi:hypothetical protein N665_0111s0060 [Sinapis alba]|nr:hypothetical protein N665_0111s0060 [Sinapis alba]
MAPRGRRKKAGLMREDAARDAMRAFGFEERVIKVCIKELLELYGERGWFLIEEFSYSVLLNKCLEKQGEQDNNVAEEDEMAEEQNVEMAQGEQEQTAQEEEEEQEQHVEDRRDHVDSNSTSLVGCGAETGEASVVDYASPVAAHSSDYAHHSVGGAKSSGCGWLSDEDETDPCEDSVVDDDEMIQLTPEPLCEELKELLRELGGEKKRKRPPKWDI